MKRTITTALFGLLVLAPAVCAAAPTTSHWYRPHLLPDVETALQRIQFLGLHLQPVALHGEQFSLTSGYGLARMDADSYSLSFLFQKNYQPEEAQFNLDWKRTGKRIPLAADGGDSLLTTVVLRDIGFFQIWNLPRTHDQISSCVAPMHAANGRNDALCVDTQDDAEALVDALATLVKASGGSLKNPFGFWARQGQFKVQKSRQMTGWTVQALDLDGPPAESGVHPGDVLFTVNGKALRATYNFLSSYSAAAGSALDGGSVTLGLSRHGKITTVDVTYPALGNGELRSEFALPTAAVEVVAAPTQPSAPKYGWDHALPMPAPAPPADPEAFQLSSRALQEGDGMPEPQAPDPLPVPATTPTPTPAPRLQASADPLPLPSLGNPQTAQPQAPTQPVPAPQSAPPAPAVNPTRLGVQVRVMTASDAAIYRVLARVGFVILSVDRGGLGELMQLQPGDVILEVNGGTAVSLESLSETVRSGVLRSLKVWRNGQSILLKMPANL